MSAKSSEPLIHAAVPMQPVNDIGSKRKHSFRSRGFLLMLYLALSIAALAARSFAFIGLLAIVNLVLGLMSSFPLRRLLNILRWFLLQTVIITGLYLIRFGAADGLNVGLRISCQILFGFLPIMMMMHAIPHSQLVRLFTLLMPYRAAFVLTTSLAFIPVLKKEFVQIYEAQRFRGARITIKDLGKPNNWNDVIHCLLVPFVVQGYKITENAATAAKIRHFNALGKRTYWNGENEP